MTLRAIKNHIIFKFVDSTNNKGLFDKEKTETGIVLQTSFDDSAKEPRWVEVVSAGPDCKDAKAGQQVLLPALRWTQAASYNGSKVWKSDETEVVAVRENSSAPITPINSWLIFRRAEKDIRTSVAGLIVVRGVGNTPTGYVVSLGPDCDPVLSKAKIYFDEANFFNDFYQNKEKLSFIKQDDVLVYEPIE